MNDVRKILALGFEKLNAIASEYNLKGESLPQEKIEDLCLAITDVESTLHEAALRTAGYVTVNLYAIGKESAPGEYLSFTHGPVPQRELMEEITGLEDGDCLVRMSTTQGVTNNVTLSVWMDDKWEETGDEEKEATA